MANIQAFRAHRYDMGRVGNMSEVVAPPYDVIDEKLQEHLYNNNPYNVIRLELNKELPTDTETNNRYTRSAAVLRDWIAEDILIRDGSPALYVYEQEYVVEGKTHLRKGFMARVRLEPFGTGKIFPHEETLAGPKADRLKLYQATNMNLSPVFGLYPDDNCEVMAKLEKAVGQALPMEATDHLGTISRLWTIHDHSVVSAVTGLMGPKPVFIADGHHRYETGLKYLEEKKAAGEVLDSEAAPNFILMMLVSMSDPGLLILPTHRLVSGLKGITSEQVQKALEGHFKIEKVGTGNAAALDAWESIEADGGQDLLAFGTLADNTWILGRLTDTSAMDKLAAAHSGDWRGLGVSILHVLVLDHLMKEKAGHNPSCKYVHLLGEVQDALAKKECDLAVLVAPAGMDHVEEIAGNLEKMPPKSTYFYPKLLSGLLFNSLKNS